MTTPVPVFQDRGMEERENSQQLFAPRAILLECLRHPSSSLCAQLRCRFSVVLLKKPSTRMYYFPLFELKNVSSHKNSFPPSPPPPPPPPPTPIKITHKENNSSEQKQKQKTTKTKQQRQPNRTEPNGNERKRTEPNRTEMNRTETKRNETKRNKTKQNKTKQKKRSVVVPTLCGGGPHL